MVNSQLLLYSLLPTCVEKVVHGYTAVQHGRIFVVFRAEDNLGGLDAVDALDAIWAIHEGKEVGVGIIFTVFILFDISMPGDGSVVAFIAIEVYPALPADQAPGPQAGGPVMK